MLCDYVLAVALITGPFVMVMVGLITLHRLKELSIKIL